MLDIIIDSTEAKKSFETKVNEQVLFLSFRGYSSFVTNPSDKKSKQSITIQKILSKHLVWILSFKQLDSKVFMLTKSTHIAVSPSSSF